MTIAIAQMEVFSADLRRNKQAMLTLIEIAKQNAAELIIFPELCVSGLLVGAQFEDAAFVRDCAQIGTELAREAEGITVIFGNLDQRADGLYNTCFMAKDGLLGRLEAPMGASYIAGAYQPFVAEVEAKTYNIDMEGKLYRCGFLLGDWRGRRLPFATKEIDLLVNLSSRPFTSTPQEDSPYVPERPFIQMGCCGLQSSGKTNYLLVGGSYLLNAQGEQIAREPDFYESVGLWNLKKGGRLAEQLPAEALLGEALVKGTRCFCDTIGAKRAVIGMSGGIDSALAACIYSRALGAENVLSLTMPSKYNSSLTQELADGMVQALDTNYLQMPIQVAMDSLLASFAWSSAHDPEGEEFKLEQDTAVIENMQSRERMRLLAAAAASWGAIFTCNGNKAELSVGYSTFYGDLAGAFAAQADLWKHQVYEVSAYFQRRYYPDAPLDRIAAIRPSAELSPQQSVDQGLGDPLIYAYHDYLLKAWVENGANLTDILTWYSENQLAERLGCTPEIVTELFPDAAALVRDMEYWWLLYRSKAVAKRLQAPPLLAMSSRPFGEAKTEIQAAPYFSQDYLSLKQQLLG